jgi:LRR receptor-like serine/threonine-protein kinase FLS2
MECHCNFGYSGSDCGNPFVYALVIGLPTAVILAVILALSARSLVRLYHRATSYRVQSEARGRLLHRSEQKIAALERVWRIDLSSIRLIQEIGTGASGTVYRAQWGGIDVAVKMLSDTMRDYTNQVAPNAEFENEIMQLRALRHKNIVQFYGAGHVGTTNEPFIVTELCERGSLYGILSNHTESLSAQRRISFARDAATGIAFLHNQSPALIHRGTLSQKN